MASNDNKRTLEQWVSLIRDQEMPIFGHTVQSIVSVAEDDEAPAAQLASTVLKYGPCSGNHSTINCCTGQA